jgi:hypothetical protein
MDKLKPTITEVKIAITQLKKNFPNRLDQIDIREKIKSIPYHFSYPLVFSEVRDYLDEIMPRFYFSLNNFIYMSKLDYKNTYSFDYVVIKGYANKSDYFNIIARFAVNVYNYKEVLNEVSRIIIQINKLKEIFDNYESRAINI